MANTPCPRRPLRLDTLTLADLMLREAGATEERCHCGQNHWPRAIEARVQEFMKT